MKAARDYLLDLADEVAAVERFTVDGERAFFTDERIQYAVMMAYARIGEIAKRIPAHLLDTQPAVPWQDVKGFRDILLHRYNEINLERVWEAVEQLPTLRAAVNSMLAALPPEEE